MREEYLPRIKVILTDEIFIREKLFENIVLNFTSFHKNILSKLSIQRLRVDTNKLIIAIIVCISEVNILNPTLIKSEIRNDDLIVVYECYLDGIITASDNSFTLKHKDQCFYILCLFCLNHLRSLNNNEVCTF